MGKQVVQISFDVLYDEDYIHPARPLDEVLSEACESMGYKLVGYQVVESMTEQYEKMIPELFEEHTLLRFSPTDGKMIQFDDFCVESEEEYCWAGLCESCRQKYEVSDSYIDVLSGDGACGVYGCSNEADHYIDMPIGLCELIRDGEL